MASPRAVGGGAVKGQRTAVGEVGVGRVADGTCGTAVMGKTPTGGGMRLAGEMLPQTGDGPAGQMALSEDSRSGWSFRTPGDIPAGGGRELERCLWNAE